MKSNKKVGVLTLPLSTNYGGVLQTYALMTVLKKMDCDAHFINRRWNNNRNDVKYRAQKWFYKNIIAYNFTKFIKKHLIPTTQEITSQQQMEKINLINFDAIIVGSDQVWRLEHTTGVGNNYFLDFVMSKKQTKKVSYAASFGIDYLNCSEKLKNQVCNLIKDFDAISVREDSGVELCKKEFDITPQQVLDPTLLIEAEEYLKLINEKCNKNKSNIITTYILDESEDKQKIIDRVAKYKHLKINKINKNTKSLAPIYLLMHPNKIILPSISQWIKGISDADFIVTDSFHGTVFSIIFNKQFICIANKERGLTRFTSLLKIFNLERRIVFTYEDLNNRLMDEKIDFDKVNKILDEQRKKSLKFLKNSL